MLLKHEPQDNLSYRFPVSVKGVVIRNGQVILLNNEREEWELPGGKLELNESPEECVVREINEELGLEVIATTLLDTWVYEITPEVRVFIVTYGCIEVKHNDVLLSHEHKQLAWVPLPELDTLPIPAGYKNSIENWSQLYHTSGLST
jgi:mutator protein MutT